MHWYPQDQLQPTASYDLFHPAYQDDQHQQPQAPPTPQHKPDFTPIDPSIRNGSKKRRACNECKQQKLRCDLSTMVNRTVETCARCNRLGLECRIDQSFRRERKRKRTDELEKEVVSLKEELQRQSSSAYPAGEDQHVSVNHRTRGDIPRSDIGSMADFRSLSERPAANSSSTSPQMLAYDYDYSGAVGAPLAEKPGKDQGGIRALLRESRILGDVQLSPDTIDDLFREYFIHYHPFLPFLDPDIMPTQYFSSSPLLFWAIISVASRRYDSAPDLLVQLAQNVTSLVWKTLQATPFSIHVVQALALLCTWPFPPNNSTPDLRYMWTGMMMQIGIHIGLHQLVDPLEVNEVEQLSKGRLLERVTTWAASNIVAQDVSVATGLNASLQCDWSMAAELRSNMSPIQMNPHLEIHLRIGMFCDNVTRSMASDASDASDSADAFPMHNKMSLYYTFTKELADMENLLGDVSDLDQLYLCAARLHLQSFYLFDDPSSNGYTERIVALHFTALSFLQHALHGISRYYPYFLSQTFIASTFITLKILRNDYFANFVDIVTGTQFVRTAIKEIRSMSLADYDCPTRFVDVLAFFWHAPAHILSGRGIHGLQLHIRSRSSMSVVHDCIWCWTKHTSNYTDAEGLPCQQQRHDDQSLLSHDTTLPNSIKEAHYFDSASASYAFSGATTFTPENDFVKFDHYA